MRRLFLKRLVAVGVAVEASSIEVIVEITSEFSSLLEVLEEGCVVVNKRRRTAD